MKKHPVLLWLMKYAVAGLLLLFLSHQVDVVAVWGHLRTLDVRFLVVVFGVFNLSQVVAALRMHYYYHMRGLALSKWFCIKLYYVSMLYNIVVPGGVGGDAYKVFLLKKQRNFSVSEGIKLQVANRASGLLAMCVQMFGLLIFPLIELWGWVGVLLPFGALIITYISYRVLAVKLLQETIDEAFGAFPYSLAIQSCALAAFAVLWYALGGAAHVGMLNDYLLLFLVANVVGMIPITMGGLGLREMTFFYGATILYNLVGHQMTPELGVSLSLSYFAVSMLSSFIGVVWMHSLREV